MSDIRKRVGPKGTTYQVRYPSKSTKSGYGYESFATRKEAQAFLESGRARTRAGQATGEIKTVPQAVDRWLQICEKIGRNGREKVEPETLKEYRHRANIMQQYAWTKELHELAPADMVQFRDWLLENRTRDQARRTFSSFHSVLIEMIHQGHLAHDPAAGISIRSGGRYESEDSEVDIPSDRGGSGNLDRGGEW